MELDEYRESIDIDLFCIGKDAYRAVRSGITQNDFGELFSPQAQPQLFKGREIRADRDAIRSVLAVDGRAIKLEIIHFEFDLIFALPDYTSFPVPSIGKEACYATKLLANADRYQTEQKDIVDLCMMYEGWGLCLRDHGKPPRKAMAQL